MPDDFVWPALDCDWRGTLIEPGCIVVYHAQTKGGKTVEAEVVEITAGDPYRGKTIMVRPIRESMIAVARPPGFYPREDKQLRAVPQLNVTVIKPFEKCYHQYWDFGPDGTTTHCRKCGVDTTYMEGMGG